MKKEMQKRAVLLTKLLHDLASYYDKSLSDMALEIYLRELIKYDFEEVKKVAFELTKECKFMPKVSEFLEKLEKESKQSVETAWIELMDTIERVGYYGTPKFNDKTIYAVMQAMGGWETLCSMPLDKLNFYKKEFTELYESYKDRKDIILNALPHYEDKKALTEGKKEVNKIINKMLMDKQ